VAVSRPAAAAALARFYRYLHFVYNSWVHRKATAREKKGATTLRLCGAGVDADAVAQSGHASGFSGMGGVG
jgi:hypothetical protein